VALRRFVTVFGAAVWSPSTYVTAGEVLSPAAPAVGVVWIGRYPGGTHPALDSTAEDLRHARHLVQVVAGIRRWKAGKLLPILGNALDALYRPSELRDRAAAALRAEALEVYGAAGLSAVDIPAEASLDLGQFTIAPLPDRPAAGRSTWQSLARGASPESDFLNGEIVLLARLPGVDAPRNAAILARVNQAALDRTPPGSLGDDDLLEVLPEIATRSRA
jgi:ketopantoate reductase